MRIVRRSAVIGAGVFVMLLAFHEPAQAQNKCLAGKIACVIKKKSCLLCLTIGDAPTIEAKVDAFDDDVITELSQ